MDLLQSLANEFAVSTDKMNEVAQNFKKAIENGLKGGKSPLLMMPSYIGKPSGEESGTFLAVDMGGTNVRVAKFSIKDRKITKIAEVSSGLRSNDGTWDYTTSKTTAEELFDFFAGKIAQIVGPGEKYLLGHTFSFPTKQTDINTATLLMWMKEISVTGAVGKNPNQLLLEALKRKKLDVKPCAIINDTVGTLLVAACQYADADIGTILGTGHNTCYAEPSHPVTGKPMIVNMESANFDWELPFTEYDNLLDAASNKPGGARLEKMVSGVYLGELVRIILSRLASQGSLLKDNSKLKSTYSEKNSLPSKEVSEFIRNRNYIELTFDCSPKEAEMIQNISAMVIKRGARLAAGTYIGTVLHIDPELRNQHMVAVDGSIYEKMTGFKEELRRGLDEALGNKADKIRAQLVKDGSGAGAAVAAAMVTEN
ncbi:MAG TPA: hexokinase [Firmicutes bacterium]|jgi:hexokinase|nr:hexokinase [Bacillota bacterium]